MRQALFCCAGGLFWSDTSGMLGNLTAGINGTLRTLHSNYGCFSCLACCAGGLFRSAAPMLGNLTAGMNGTMTNLTSILTGNSTTNGTDAAPTMESDMDGMIDMVNSTRAANMAAAVNSTSAGNSTKAASRSKPQPKRRFMFF